MVNNYIKFYIILLLLFSLSYSTTSSVIDRKGRNVIVSISKYDLSAGDLLFLKEGNYLDPKTNNGWLLVKKITSDTTVKAQIISGKPYPGMLVKYYHSKWYAGFKFQSFVYNTDYSNFDNPMKNTLTFSNPYGGTFEFGPRLGEKIADFFLLFSNSYSGTSADGYLIRTPDPLGEITDSISDTLWVKSAQSWEFDLTLLKRFSFRRFSVSLQGGVGTQIMMLMEDLNKSEQDFNLNVNGGYIGLVSNINADFAVSPKLRIGGGVGYHYFGTTNEITLEDIFKTQSELIKSVPTINFNGFVWNISLTIN